MLTRTSQSELMCKIRKKVTKIDLTKTDCSEPEAARLGIPVATLPAYAPGSGLEEALNAGSGGPQTTAGRRHARGSHKVSQDKLMIEGAIADDGGAGWTAVTAKVQLQAGFALTICSNLTAVSLLVEVSWR